MSAAAFLFEQHGFRDTGVDAIAARARVSKRTIYECFSDKSAILEAVLADFTDHQFQEIALASRQARTSEERLRIIVERFQNAATDGQSVAMERLHISEAEHMPETATLLAQRGQNNALELLRPILLELGVADVDGIATLLYDVFVLAPLQRRLTDTGARPLDAQRKLGLLLKGILSSDEVDA